MKLQRISRIMVILAAAIMIGLPATVQALDSYSAGYDTSTDKSNHIAFTYDGSWKVSFDASQIVSATGGSSDPIIGKWQSISNPTQSSYNYLMVSQTTPGSNIWTLAGGANQIVVTSSTGEVLLSGMATAQTIDLNTGTIYWGEVTDLKVDNTIGSDTLKQFASYTTGILTMTYKMSSSLSNWIGADNVSKGTKTSHYYTSLGGSDLTAVPEPSTWALILMGMIFLGYSFWQHSGAGEVFSDIRIRS